MHFQQTSNNIIFWKKRRRRSSAPDRKWFFNTITFIFCHFDINRFGSYFQLQQRITVSVLIVSGIHIEIRKFRIPCYQNVTLSVLVFGPESVSYERSRRETTAKFNIISARVFFCKNTPASVFNDIFYISVFSRNMFLKLIFSQMFQSPDPAARPPLMDHRLSTCLGFQYFQVQN